MVNKVILHHSGGTDLNPLQNSAHYTVQQCNMDHKARFNMRSSLGWYVGYHYFISTDGIVTKCREEGEMGAHTIGQNDQIGCCLAGNFDVSHPTQKQKDSFIKLLADIKTRHPNVVVASHNLYAKKTCPGKYGDEFVKSLLLEQVSYLQRILAWFLKNTHNSK